MKQVAVSNDNKDGCCRFKLNQIFFLLSLVIFLYSILFNQEVQAQACQSESCGSVVVPTPCSTPPATGCGNGVCSSEEGEDSTTCPQDCGVGGSCGDGVCSSALGENNASCPQDCGSEGYCGDGVC
ncbi:MAG: hypothetical protein KBC84_04715, partial [Proteobacteria bacterium]|nr:hypothetical protein [Pseudomonadota bacterium]